MKRVVIRFTDGSSITSERNTVEALETLKKHLVEKTFFAIPAEDGKILYINPNNITYVLVGDKP